MTLNVRRARVVFDGQSLNVVPGPVTTFPYRTMRYYPNVPYSLNDVAVSGTSWTVLNANAPQRVDPLASLAPFTILNMCGGTSDLWAPELNDGPTVYADMVAYANARRTAGFDYVIAVTIAPSTTFDATQESNRVSANSLIMADASNAFDAQVDFAGIPQLTDPNNTTYYFDGTHYTGPATILCAAALAPAMGTALKLAG